MRCKRIRPDKAAAVILGGFYSSIAPSPPMYRCASCERFKASVEREGGACVECRIRLKEVHRD